MKKLTLGLFSTGVLIVVILYLTGAFTPGRISPDSNSNAIGKPFSGNEHLVTEEVVDEYYWGVGTLQSKTQSTLSAQISGTITSVLVKDGEMVSKGQLLIKIDDREFMTILREAEKGLESAKISAQQANQTLLQAQALYQQALAAKIVAEQEKERAISGSAAAEENERRAEAEYNRTLKLFESGSTTQAALDNAKAAYVGAKASARQAKISISTAESGIAQAGEAVKAAEAGKNQANSGIENAELGIQRAQEVLKRAEISLSYTRITAPGDGFIGSTFVDSGNLVYAGIPLVDFYSRSGFEVLTYVRESLFGKVKIGDQYNVNIDSISYSCAGKVTEVIPSADPMSRTFLVKVEIEEQPSIFPGMFARVGIPVGKRKAILVPSSAVKNVGMLEIVTSKSGDFGVNTFVKTGAKSGDKVEIISGLAPGDIISVKEVR